jgi:hypothetical protein
MASSALEPIQAYPNQGMDTKCLTMA